MELIHDERAFACSYIHTLPILPKTPQRPKNVASSCAVERDPIGTHLDTSKVSGLVRMLQLFSRAFSNLQR